MSEAKKEWYVVNTYAGHENRVKENLERRVETMGLQDFLFQIIVAEEKEIEYKNGKEVEKTKNLFSGYLFVQMIMTDEAWYIVRNTPGVTGFIGSSGKGAKPFRCNSPFQNQQPLFFQKFKKKDSYLFIREWYFHLYGRR